MLSICVELHRVGQNQLESSNSEQCWAIPSKWWELFRSDENCLELLRIAYNCLELLLSNSKQFQEVLSNSQQLYVILSNSEILNNSEQF